MNELSYAILIFITLFLLVIIADFIQKKFKVDPKSTRMFVHASVAIVVFFAPLMLRNEIFPIALASIFIFANFTTSRLRMFQGINLSDRNLGTVYYPLSFLILILLFWDSKPFLVSTAMIVMGFADPLAAVFGRRATKPHIVEAFGEKKTLEGSVAMFAMATLSVFLGILFFRDGFGQLKEINYIQLIIMSATVGLVVAPVELISPKSTDNLTVPLISALIIDILVSNHHIIVPFAFGELLAIIFGFVSFRLKFLSKDGSVAAFLIGSFLFGLGGWKWTLPMLFFFLAGSLGSRLFLKHKSVYNLMYEKGHTRDAGQVFANGGVGLGIFLIQFLYPNPLWYLSYLGSLSAVTADTMATELGILSIKDPFSFVQMKRVEKGVSGGVSYLGTFAGLLSGGALGLVALPFADVYRVFPIRLIVAIAFSGLIGSITDSLIGGSIQGQYQCEICLKITERENHCGRNSTKLVRGYEWVNNDLVNFTASAVGAIAMMLLFV
jgi:Predicted membrane protein